MEEKKNNEVGALRESIERGYEKWYAAGCHESGCGCVTAYIEREIASLSLSSPIEQRGEIYQLGFKTLAVMIRFQFPDFDENHVSESLARIAARPTPQASSEIRERIAKALNDVGTTGRANLTKECVDAVMEALAPSRQGAPDNSDHYWLDKPRQGATK